MALLFGNSASVLNGSVLVLVVVFTWGKMESTLLPD